MTKLPLNTSRLTFSEFSKRDAEGFFLLNSDPEVMRFTGDVAFKNLEETLSFIRKYNDYELHGMGRWTIRLKSTDKYIGWCGLKYHPDTQEVDIGFRLMHNAWNKGFATEAAIACLEWAKKKEVKKVVARCMIHNSASKRVIEKLGFAFTHSFKEDEVEWHQHELEL
ncbi:GNAT family N-acetyltransferase [Flammeovirga yaeyamensis]|uniref:GNAT family N-acetyltransferase n=1 Tax=Flammeovirga yaeyamensis TaxID=367791 RepID=A0AAX1N5X4_9BACT|nr:GNAT family N-acetyltransferase [Flammeovirga yaeyamensis]MBB3697448.1 RimJ/RimL family protein N-acetyltransferase [Flammeovirga yaeyamensis]NMF36142.1 GNAT family N-acetyltransferase [Flammeovirga yaeyamensis]QWG02875.1 GNAT family N-acetyltransferase [Flammeovirga yaeyamensis]